MADEDRKLVADFALMPMAEKGFPLAPRIFGTSQQKMITSTELFRPLHNFYSLTIRSYDQYLLNGSENKCLHP